MGATPRSPGKNTEACLLGAPPHGRRVPREKPRYSRHAEFLDLAFSPCDCCRGPAPKTMGGTLLKETTMADNSAATITTGKVMNIVLPLFLLALLIALCVQLLLPFVGLLVWTIILAICFKPLHDRLTTRRGLSSRWSAIIIGTALSALVLVPTAIAAISAASSVPCRCRDDSKRRPDGPSAPRRPEANSDRRDQGLCHVDSSLSRYACVRQDLSYPARRIYEKAAGLCRRIVCQRAASRCRDHLRRYLPGLFCATCALICPGFLPELPAIGRAANTTWTSSPRR